MKRFNSVILTVFLTCSCFVLFTYTACNKDRCEAVTCMNGGACAEGKCICPDNYSGTYCTIKSDPCDKLKCQQNATCVDGACFCPVGYQGLHCELLTRDYLVGTYTGIGGCNGDSNTYSVQLIAGAADRELILKNVDNSGVDLVCTMTSHNRLVIDTFSKDVAAEGELDINRGKLKLIYTLRTDRLNTGGFCEFEGTK